MMDAPFGVKLLFEGPPSESMGYLEIHQYCKRCYSTSKDEPSMNRIVHMEGRGIEPHPGVTGDSSFSKRD